MCGGCWHFKMWTVGSESTTKTLFQTKPCEVFGCHEQIEAERWHRFHPQFCEMKNQIGFQFPDKNQLSCPKKTWCLYSFDTLAFQQKPPAKPRMWKKSLEGRGSELSGGKKKSKENKNLQVNIHVLVYMYLHLPTCMICLPSKLKLEL